MATLWRALLEGFGWHVGKRAAKEAVSQVEKALTPEPPPPPPDPAQLEADRKACLKAEARVSKERTAAARREEKAIDAELRAMKKKLRR